MKYAVGMTCYHNKYDYVCIIRGWDAQCALKWQCQMAAESLYFGVTQPFYNVIAADQSERYVPQGETYFTTSHFTPLTNLLMNYIYNYFVHLWSYVSYVYATTVLFNIRQQGGQLVCSENDLWLIS